MWSCSLACEQALLHFYHLEIPLLQFAGIYFIHATSVMFLEIPLLQFCSCMMFKPVDLHLCRNSDYLGTESTDINCLFNNAGD